MTHLFGKIQGVSLSHDFMQTLVPCILWVLSLGCTHTGCPPVYFSLRLQDLIRTLSNQVIIQEESGGWEPAFEDLCVVCTHILSHVISVICPAWNVLLLPCCTRMTPVAIGSRSWQVTKPRCRSCLSGSGPQTFCTVAHWSREGTQDIGISAHSLDSCGLRFSVEIKGSWCFLFPFKSWLLFYLLISLPMTYLSTVVSRWDLPTFHSKFGAAASFSEYKIVNRQMYSVGVPSDIKYEWMSRSVCLSERLTPPPSEEWFLK